MRLRGYAGNSPLSTPTVAVTLSVAVTCSVSRAVAVDRRGSFVEPASDSFASGSAGTFTGGFVFDSMNVGADFVFSDFLAVVAGFFFFVVKGSLFFVVKRLASFVVAVVVTFLVVVVGDVIVVVGVVVVVVVVAVVVMVVGFIVVAILCFRISLTTIGPRQFLSSSEMIWFDDCSIP